MLEALVELLLEFVLEVVLQVVFEALASAGVHAARQAQGRDAEVPIWLAAPGYALLGGAVGAASLLVIPDAVVRSQAGRVGTLLLAPLAAGAAMALIGALRARRGRQVLRIDRFGCGYLFALAMAAVRFVYAG